MTCNPTSDNGHGYVIVVIDYFTKWVEALSTFSNNGTITTLFIIKHIISKLGAPNTIVMNHGSHFHYNMMTKVYSTLVFLHEISFPYYPYENGLENYDP